MFIKTHQRLLAIQLYLVPITVIQNMQNTVIQNKNYITTFVSDSSTLNRTAT